MMDALIGGFVTIAIVLAVVYAIMRWTQEQDTGE